MNGSETQNSFHRDRLHAALGEIGGVARPDYLPDIVAQAGRVRQRPAWTFLERWLPMDIAVGSRGVPRAAVLFAALSLLVALLVASVLYIGTQRTQPERFVASNGLIAFMTGHEIVVVEPDGSGRRTLIDGLALSGPMAFSPDGRWLAYWTLIEGSTATWKLMVVDPDGGAPVTVSTWVGDGDVTGQQLLEFSVFSLFPGRPSWSPDGSTIAFAAPSSAGFRVFLAAVDGSGTRQIGDPELAAWGPSWSPDGSTIAFGAGDFASPGGVHLFLMDADGSNVRQLGDVRGNGDHISRGFAFARTDWSSDGTKVTTQASAAGDINEMDIWVINADGTGAANVGAGAGEELWPSWAPDRDALIWEVHGQGTVLLEQGSEHPKPLPLSRGIWSPDEKLLAGRATTGLIVTDLDGSVQLTIDGPAIEIAWQPRPLGWPAPTGPGTVPTPSVLPSVASSEAARSVEPSSSPDGFLPEGPFVLWDPATQTAPFNDGVPITVTISALGWAGDPAGAILVKNDNGDPPDGAGIVVDSTSSGIYVYGDPCHWSTTIPDTPATTVDELVAALEAQASRDASAPVDVTVGGYTGKSITLHVPNDAATRDEAFAECDQNKFASYGVVGETGPARYHQGPGQIDELWIVDVNGALTIIDAMYGAETPADHVDELRAIVESATFE